MRTLHKTRTSAVVEAIDNLYLRTGEFIADTFRNEQEYLRVLDMMEEIAALADASAASVSDANEYQRGYDDGEIEGKNNICDDEEYECGFEAGKASAMSLMNDE